MKRVDKIIRENQPTLVVFEHLGAEQDAVELKYLVDSLRKNFAGKAKIVTADATNDGNLKTDYKLKEYPTWILFKQGEELMRESGRKHLSDLEDMLQRAI